MAQPVVIAKNQTGSGIFLPTLGITVPASPATYQLTDDATFFEVVSDPVLNTQVAAGNIVINDGTTDLPTLGGVAYLNASGNLDGPVSGATTNVLVKLSDTSGRRTLVTGITVDASDNLTGVGTINGVTPTALASTAPANVTKAAAAVGVGTTAARADHKHDVSTAAPTTNLSATTGNTEGAATSLARSNHSHTITTGAPGATGVGTASATGTSANLARADHVHQSNTAPTNVTKAAAVIGTSGQPARADHKHDVTTASAVAVGTANAEGVSTSLARADHTHQVTGLVIAGQVQGDVLYYNGISWVRLPPGTSGQFLQTQGAAANPQWAAGGATDHTTLSNLGWTVSGHTGTASRVAAFDGAGAASFLQVGVDLQAWDTDLDALAGLATTGIIVRSGSGTAVTRSIIQPAAGITVSNGSGVAGNPTLALANDLLALENLAGTGFAVRTAADTWAQRTLTGTANLITITNGTGVAGNPVFTVGANVIQTTTSLGGDLSGTLPNPTVVDLSLTGEAQGTIAYYNGTNWVVLPVGTAGQVLQTQGAAANPQWVTGTDSDEQVKVSANDTTPGYLLDKIITSTTGVTWVEVNNGGDEDLRLDINTTSLTGQGLIELATQVEVDAGSDAVRAVTPATLASATTVLKPGDSAGGDLNGTYPNPTVTDLTITGESQGSVLYFNGTNWVRLAPGVSGRVLQTQGVGADPVWAVDANTTDHAALSNLAWGTSGHTGTASRVAAFDGGGAASFLQVGVDLQAWDTDLDALAGLGTTGIIVRSGSGTAVTRTLVAPAAGIGIANANGVAGNPTFSLTNDLLALEGLGSTGFAVRTAGDTWAQRSLTAPAAGFTITNPAGIAGNPTFVLADDLAALEAMAGTGMVARTAANTYAQRTLTQPAAGIIISNADGVAGNPTFALANDLAALEGMTGTGVVVRTATNTYAQRTLTGTASHILITNGDGIAGNPTFDVGANVILTTTNLGGDLSGNLPNPTVTDLTITGEVKGSILYFNGTNWVRLAPGTVNQVLQTLGAGTDPVWYTIPAAAYADYYNSGSQNITTTATTVALNTTRQTNAAFTRAANQITINTGGDYRIDFDLGLDDNDNLDRTIEVWLEKNTVEVPGTRAKTWHDNSGDEEGSCHGMAILTLVATDVVRVRAQVNTDALDTLANSVRLLIHSIGGNGAQGATGAGANIIVQDEGVVVPGGPHSTLDFVGTAVTVTNAGSGKATITVTGGGGGGSINDLTDVDTATQPPTAGDGFVWDGVADWVPLKNNHTTTDPTITNDTTENYVVGSQWINTTNDNVWICVDNTTGAAVWLPLAGAGTTNQYFDAYDSTGGTNVNSGWTDVPLVVERKKDALYTHTASSAVVTVGETDTYLVIARVTTDQTAGNSRTDSELRLSVNGSPVAGTTATMYNRQISQGTNTGTVSAVLALTAADTIRIQAQRRSGTGTITLLAEGSSLVVVRLGIGGSSTSVGGGGTIEIEDEGSSVVGAATLLNFVGAGVTASDAGGGEATITIPGPTFPAERHVFYADQLENPVNANWTVNALAPAQADSVNAALTVRAFDDTAQEGVGFSMHIPTGATNVTFRFASRAATTPPAARVVGLNLYRRTISDNAAVTAWSALLALTNIDIPTNANFQYDSQTVTLATLGLTAGNWVQFELTRNPAPSGGTDLTGDWLLLSIVVEFT